MFLTFYWSIPKAWLVARFLHVLTVLVVSMKSEQLNHYCRETWLQKWATTLDCCKFTGQMSEACPLLLAKETPRFK